MTIDSKLLVRIVLLLVVLTASVWWLRASVVTIHFDDDYVHANCCKSHGGCEDKEKCAAGTASCCSNKDCGKCCGSAQEGIPVCRATKAAANLSPETKPSPDSTTHSEDKLTQAF